MHWIWKFGSTEVSWSIDTPVVLAILMATMM